MQRWWTPAPVLAIATMAALAGCGSLPGGQPLGASIDTVRQGRTPTAEYRLPDGGTRLEYMNGRFGKQTWMLDFDASGKLVANRQVLTEQEFARIRPGMEANTVLATLGHPAETFGVPWQRLQVWNYRWWQGDCQWFQVSLDTAGRVTESGISQDPACDVGRDRD